MVQPEVERQLDDVILDVFEQCGSLSSERHFYFPVTSQREARAFVQELHTRGVQYSSISAAVGEYEQSFRAWRTGLSQPGIGNRVVERINRPLQQLLLDAIDDNDDDDDDDDVTLSDVEDDDDFLTQFSSSLPATPVKQLEKTSSAVSAGRTKTSTQHTTCTDSQQLVKTTQTNAKTEDTDDQHDHNSPSDVNTDVELEQSNTDDQHDHNSPSDVNTGVELEQSKSGMISIETNNNNNNNKDDNDKLCSSASSEVVMTTDERDVTDDGAETQRSNAEVDRQLLEIERLETVDQIAVSIVDDAGNNELEERTGQTEDNWVTELSVNLTTHAETSNEERQICVTSAAAAASAAAADQSLSSMTCSMSPSETSVTTSNSSAVSHHRTTDTSETSPPEVDTSAAATDQSLSSVTCSMSPSETSVTTSNSSAVSHHRTTDTSETSQPDVDSNHCSVTTSNVATNECTTAMSDSSDPSLPEVDGYITSQPEILTTSADVVDNSEKPEVVAALDQRDMSSQETAIDESANVTSSTPDVTSSDMRSETERQCVLTSQRLVESNNEPITALSHCCNTDSPLPQLNDGYIASQPETALVDNSDKPEVVTVLDHVEMTSQATTNDELTVTGNSDDMTSSTADESEAAVRPEVTSSCEVTSQATTSDELTVTGNSTDMTSSTADESEAAIRPEVTSSCEMTSQATTSDELTFTGNSVDMTSSTADESEAAVRPEVTSLREVRSESDDGEIVLRKTSRKTNVCSVDDVDENYDSDLDQDDCDHQDDSDIGCSDGRGRHKRGKRWARQYDDDGPGYVYVFTDTPADCLTHCRCKISASRRPDARLRQAQLFNVDMRLVTAVRVSSRLAAATLLRQTLVDCAIPLTSDWFSVSLDVVVNSVMDVARIYSPSSSDNLDH